MSIIKSQIKLNILLNLFITKYNLLMNHMNKLLKIELCKYL